MASLCVSGGSNTQDHTCPVGSELIWSVSYKVVDCSWVETGKSEFSSFIVISKLHHYVPSLKLELVLNFTKLVSSILVGFLQIPSSYQSVIPRKEWEQVRARVVSYVPFHLQIPVVVLAIQLLLLLGVTWLLCHPSDSETYWLADLAGFFVLPLYSWIKFLANVVAPFPLPCWFPVGMRMWCFLSRFLKGFSAFVRGSWSW